MRIATLCSAHGFGHVTRELVIADALEAQGADVTLFTAAPAAITGSRHTIPWVADVGIAQRDSLTEDVEATLERLEIVASNTRIDALAERLAGYDRVVVDIAPPALEAARRAGVPAFAVGNFDWAWIYRHYPALHAWADQFARWQAPHPALFLAPGPGLHGFATTEAFDVVGRKAATPPREEGGALRGGRQPPLPHEEAPSRTVLVCFGGFGLDGIDAWLPTVPGVTWVLAPPMTPVERPDVRFVADVPFPTLVATADALLTKPGYGIYAEAALAGTPIVWVDRGQFPEAPYLEAALRARGDVKAEGRGAGRAEAVAAALAKRWATRRPPPVSSDAAMRLALRILGPER